MKAVTFKDRRISIYDAPVPDIADNEALVRISLAGICATDVAILHGYAQFSGIPGHEFVGVVEAAPSRPDLVGKRVVADINIGCGHCERCRCADARHCEARTVIGIRGRDGVFAEYCTLPVKNLHVVPDAVESIWAVFAEPLAAALEITQQLHITHADRIAVIGDGKMGLLTALSLVHFSSKVLLIGRHSRKLSIAAQQGVATKQTVAGALENRLSDELGKFDIVIDATGSHEGIHTALALAKPEGIVAVKTTSHKHSEIDLSVITVNELTLIGSRCGDMGLAMKYLEQGWVDTSPLIDTVYPFSRFADAFARAMQKESLKVLIAFGEDGAGNL